MWHNNITSCDILPNDSYWRNTVEKHQIFISYRRDGGDSLAGRIADRLNGMGYTVFHDIDSMLSGSFRDQLYSALDGCTDVIVVLSKNALDRCTDEADFVRKEIAHAISLGKNIIPAIVPGFAFPETLPADIDDIRWYEGFEANSTYFDASMEKLYKLLKSEPVNQNSVDEDLDKGIRFIRNKLYEKALETLDTALEKDMANPEVHFYLAAALLGGKRPFLVPKDTVKKAEEHLNTAISLGCKAVYLYFLAYIKKDFYENKALRAVPSSKELVASALQSGIEERSINELFSLLGQTCPVF